MRGKKVLVIGASVQIGGALALALAKGNKVTGLSRFSNDEFRQELEDAGVRTIAKDLVADPLEDIADEYDAVLNQATGWARQERGNNIALSLNGYLQGRLMERTRSAVHIYGSTMAVPDDQPPLIDELTPTRTKSGVYSSTKLVGESLTVHLSDFRDIRAAILRYMWPVGSHQLRGPDALLDLIRRVIKGESIELQRCLQCRHPDGRDTKEIIGPTITPLHVDDVASLTVKAVEVAARPPEVIHVFGPVLPLSEVVGKIEEVFAVKANTEIVEPDPQVVVPYYSREKMLRLLGEQTIGLVEILQRLKERMKAKGEME